MPPDLAQIVFCIILYVLLCVLPALLYLIVLCGPMGSEKMLTDLPLTTQRFQPTEGGAACLTYENIQLWGSEKKKPVNKMQFTSIADDTATSSTGDPAQTKPPPAKPDTPKERQKTPGTPASSKSQKGLKTERHRIIKDVSGFAKVRALYKTHLAPN
jgi:hypothetical protein